MTLVEMTERIDEMLSHYWTGRNPSPKDVEALHAMIVAVSMLPKLRARLGDALNGESRWLRSHVEALIRQYDSVLSGTPEAEETT